MALTKFQHTFKHPGLVLEILYLCLYLYMFIHLSGSPGQNP